MSRLAVLSSRRDLYDEALGKLGKLYRSRGYPDKVVDGWLKQHKNLWWHDRFRTRERHESPWVLKSYFNPIWETFPVHDLEKVIKSHWRSTSVESQSVLGPWTTSTLDESFPRASLRRRTGVEALTQELRGMWPIAPEISVVKPIDYDLAVTWPLLVSKKRTRNLRDFANIWCKSLVYSSNDTDTLLSQLLHVEMDSWE